MDTRACVSIRGGWGVGEEELRIMKIPNSIKLSSRFQTLPGTSTVNRNRIVVVGPLDIQRREVKRREVKRRRLDSGGCGTVKQTS